MTSPPRSWSVVLQRRACRCSCECAPACYLSERVKRFASSVVQVMVCPACQSEDHTQFGSVAQKGKEPKKPRLSHSRPVSHLNLCHLLNLFSNASDALRAARAEGRHYVPLSLNRLGRVINTHTGIFLYPMQSYKATISLLRGDVSKNETFWAHSDPWRIFSTSSRGL